VNQEYPGIDLDDDTRHVADELLNTIRQLPPWVGLLVCHRLRSELPELQWQIARSLHDQQGVAWSDLGRAIGVSRQAARERFGVRPPARGQVT
jgi:hypothetical protein